VQQFHPRNRTAAAAAPDHRIAALGVVVCALIAASLVHPLTAPPASVRLIVHEATPSSRAAEDLVDALGGTVTRRLPLIDGFAATLREDRVPALAADTAVTEITVDGRIEMAGTPLDFWDDIEPNLAWRKTIRLGAVPDIDGRGVTVAMIDTGVARVADLGNRVVARVDFTPGGNGEDEYGHGTHLAGVIAGDGSSSLGKWRGVAPGARLISLKVAGPDGSTDVSVVIAALHWVVSHRAQFNIKVLNLAFGTDSVQSYAVDPLNAAVERAWAAGITVVVSAGNRGPGTINKPSDDPYVITVGAVDVNRTADRRDDEVASFSSYARTVDGFVKPDIVAPGTTIVAARDVGSTIDTLHPDAVLDGDYFKGTGTSQAGAVVSGVVALLYDANPLLKPNQVKSILMGSTFRASQYRTGGSSGLVDAAAAVQGIGSGEWTNADLTKGTGLGSLEGSRGRFHVHADLDGDGRLDLVEGERDVLGAPWDSTSWSSTSWSSTSWSSTSWSSLISENPGWSSTSWSSTSWSGMYWSSTSWSSTSWSSTSWSSTSWSSTTWS
ncbi:MAG TPA: S8 family peptidase, partial [Actinomycetota bacterium]|nr:S8 family peptidase [Actinomycetota bacterium]